MAAGTVSTVLFAVSVLPTVAKAARTRDLGSYSLGALVLANVGNIIHTVYVLALPAGPLWALHSMYLVTTGLMLVWFLRYVPRHPQPQVSRTDHPPTLVTPAR